MRPECLRISGQTRALGGGETLHCKLRARPGGRNESAGRGSPDSPLRALAPPGARAGPHTEAEAPTETWAPKPTQRTKLPTPLVGVAKGRAARGLRAGSCTNARACSPFSPSGGKRSHPCGASRLERHPPPCSSFRGPSHHRAGDPADAPRPSSLTQG